MADSTVSIGYVPDGIEPLTEFEHLLRELGWSKRDLAKRLHLHENTVYAWEEAPGYAMVYLRLMIKVRRFSDEVLG